VTKLIGGTRISRHEGLLINDSRERQDPLIQVGMIVDATVDQGYANSSSAIARLPSELRVDGDVSIGVRRRQWAVGADVDNI